MILMMVVMMSIMWWRVTRMITHVRRHVGRRHGRGRSRRISWGGWEMISIAAHTLFKVAQIVARAFRTTRVQCSYRVRAWEGAIVRLSFSRRRRLLVRRSCHVRGIILLMVIESRGHVRPWWVATSLRMRRWHRRTIVVPRRRHRVCVRIRMRIVR